MYLTTLAKGHSGICPQCRHRTYKNYIYTATRMPVMDGICGRCERINSCGYHMPPGKLGIHRPAAAKTKAAQPAFRPAATFSTLPRSYVDATCRRYDDNALCQYLYSLFSGILTRDTIDAIMARYCLGTAKHRRAVFWQIDTRGRVRSGKIIPYDQATGRRIKAEHTPATWVHTELKDKYPRFALRQAFFGSHLAKINPQATIWLFESEKGALIAALWLQAMGIYYDHFLPMATGGCAMLNPTPQALADPDDRHAVLRGRTVVLFPDHGKYTEWLEKGRRLIGFAERVYVSHLMEPSIGTPPSTPILPGAGPDDVFIDYIKAGQYRQIRNLDMYSAAIEP